MAELDVETLERRRADMASAGVPMMLNGPQVDELIAIMKDRDRLRAWIDNHEYLAAYPSLTECIEDQKRAAHE